MPLSLILASRSPRRTELLTACGIEHEIHTGSVDESWRQGESAVAYASRVANDKAAAALEWLAKDETRMILAADTTVWLAQRPEPFGKPRDREQARQFLKELCCAGEHCVTTAVAIRSVDASVQETLTVTTLVTMREPRPDELERYLDTLEWRDKAGGYGIQGQAAGLVRELRGSYTNVVGLPLAELLELLGRLTSDL